MLRDDSHILAVEPETYRNWLDQLKASSSWSPTLLEELRGPQAAARLKPARKDIGDIAVVKLSGFITQKASILTEFFGGTSTESLVATIRAAMAEPSVGAIVLDVASPGGSVFGVPEAAAAIRALRGPKPMIAISNPFMASAAYYLAAQTDEIVATPSSITGSIGVLAVHIDESEAIARAGIRVEQFVHGRRKAEESSLTPLTEEAREAIQARVDYYGVMFETDVAQGRGATPASIRARYGQGAVFNAKDAVAAGVVDRIGVMEDVIGDLAAGRKPRPRLTAEADPVEVAARAALAGLTKFGGPALE